MNTLCCVCHCCVLRCGFSSIPQWITAGARRSFASCEGFEAGGCAEEAEGKELPWGRGIVEVTLKPLQGVCFFVEWLWLFLCMGLELRLKERSRRSTAVIGSMLVIHCVEKTLSTFDNKDSKHKGL